LLIADHTEILGLARHVFGEHLHHVSRRLCNDLLVAAIGRTNVQIVEGIDQTHFFVERIVAQGRQCTVEYATI